MSHKTILEAWKEHEKFAVPAGAHICQRANMKNAFYTGYVLACNHLIAIQRLSDLEIERHNAALSKEIADYYDQIKEGKSGL